VQPLQFVHCFCGVIIAAAANLVAAHTVDDKKTLRLKGAESVIAAARAEAQRLSRPGWGHRCGRRWWQPDGLERLDGRFAAGADVSIGKAHDKSAEACARLCLGR
jgi:hypothetical protein